MFDCIVFLRLIEMIKYQKNYVYIVLLKPKFYKNVGSVYLLMINSVKVRPLVDNVLSTNSDRGDEVMHALVLHHICYVGCVLFVVILPCIVPVTPGKKIIVSCLIYLVHMKVKNSVDSLTSPCKISKPKSSCTISFRPLLW